MSDKKYLGPILVTLVEELNQKTPNGKDVVKVHLENNPPLIYVKDVFERVVTSTPIDFTLLREKTHEVTLKDLTSVLLESGISYGDLAHVCKKLAEKVEDAFDRATHYLWTKRDQDWVPGVHNLNDRSILECEQILKSITNDTTPTTEETK